MRLTKRVLHRPAKPCTFGRPAQNQILAQNLLEFMHNKNGIGLAAPQIGLSKRVFVMEIDGNQRICFNPEIIDVSPDLVDFSEGCLSFPGKICTIKRPDEISVRYQNYRGDWYAERMAGLMSRCFQHELDHLDGIVMHDRYKEQHATKS